ncbi:hypothetical protein E2C01_035595 [Portunus trituberculatus]|uniref:Uncharacterized protein n=1 Tax=Portunus trituberculatus TaxID=210409 RepID=A0A5B7FBX0_PORTR|nr:hypothetical protein [Portunus trituberculatus]
MQEIYLCGFRCAHSHGNTSLALSASARLHRSKQAPRETGQRQRHVPPTQGCLRIANLENYCLNPSKSNKSVTLLRMTINLPGSLDSCCVNRRVSEAVIPKQIQ